MLERIVILSKWPSLWRSVVSSSIPAPSIRGALNANGCVRLDVKAHPGTDPVKFLAAGPSLAVAARVLRVEVSQLERSDLFSVHFFFRDFLGASFPSPLLDSPSYAWGDPIPLGMSATGSVVCWSPEQSSLLIGGVPGSGKSVSTTGILATISLDPSVILCAVDAKWGVELSSFEPVLSKLVTTRAEAVDLFAWLLQVVELRYERMRARGWRSLPPGYRRVVLLVDELAEVTAGPSPEAKKATEHLRRILALGRAAGVCVILSTQKPSSDVVDTSLRDLLGARVAFRCATPDASDTVLGRGASTRGADASGIPLGSVGRGLAMTPDSPDPVAFRGFYLSDADLSGILAISKVARTVPEYDHDPGCLPVSRRPLRSPGDGQM